MDKKPGLNKTKSTKQEAESELLANQGSVMPLRNFLLLSIFPGILGLLFTGIPSYISSYMHIYLVFMTIDLVAGIVVVKTSKKLQDPPMLKYLLFQFYFAGIWAVLGAWRVVNFQIGLGILYWGIFLSAFVIGKLFGLQIGTAIVFPERSSNKVANTIAILFVAIGSLSGLGYGMVRMVDFLDPHSANAILSVFMLLLTSLLTLIFFSFSSGGKKKKRLEQQHLSST